MTDEPLRIGDTVRQKDRPTFVGTLIRLSDGAAMIQRPDGTLYADTPCNLERAR